MPADIELSANAEAVAGSCMLQRMQPGRIAGRSEETGVARGEMLEGDTYWAGQWLLQPSDRTTEALDVQGEIEAALMAYETQRKTLRIRIGADRGLEHIVFEDSKDEVFDPPDSAVLRTAVNGKRFSLSGAVKIRIKPGFWFTHGDKLYIYAGQSEIDAASADLIDCVPPFGNVSNGDAVEFRDPYLIARFPMQEGTPLSMDGDLAGPWNVAFEEAE